MATATFDALTKQRLEKDLAELQQMISKHFDQRKKDDEELEDLTKRIEKRKAERAEQQRIRTEREQIRMQREKEERQAREDAEERRKQEEEEKKKQCIANMAACKGGYLAQRKGGKAGRVTEREKKRKILADRRKPLNIDHLAADKLKEKAQEMWKWNSILEEERYDFEVRQDRQKYELTSLRQRVNEFMIKSGKGGSQAHKKVATLANVGAKAKAFK